MGRMRNSPNVSPLHKQVTREQVAALPKVVLHDHVDTTGARGEADVEAAVRAGVRALAADGVVYAELRISPELNLDVLPLDKIVAAAERGATSVEGIDARLILTAMRHASHVADVADETLAAYPRGIVVGFDLAGPEDSPAPHAETLEKLRDAYIPVTLHAGAHEGVDSIAEALRLGALRLGHGTRIFEDLTADIDGIGAGPVASWVRDRGIVLEMAPALEVEMGVVDSYEDHPFSLLQQLGFTCTLNPGQSTVSSLTDEMMRLVETFDYGYDELFELTRTAMENAFAPVPQRTAILAQRILPAYDELSGAYNEDASFSQLADPS